MVWARPRLALAFRRAPLLGALLATLAVRASTRRGWDGLGDLVALVEAGLADPLDVARLAFESSGCPGPGAARILSSLGLHEEVVRLHYRGCRVPESLLLKARRHFIAVGLPNWEARASEALGLPSFYEAAGREVVYAYCRGGRAWLRVAGETLELGPTQGLSGARGPSEALEAFLDTARPPLLVSMGECPEWGRGPVVKGEELVAIAFPDIPPTIAALAYHLSLNPRDPGEVLEHAARAAASILEAVGVEWDRMPEGVKPARLLPPAKPRPPESGVLLVTDTPRLGAPLLKPYHIEPPSLEGKGWEYAARAAVRALAARLGDPERARRLARGELGERLSRLLDEAVKPGPPERPEGPLQVEPWSLEALRGLAGGAGVEVECLRPPSACPGIPGRPRRVSTLYYYDKPVPRSPRGLAAAAASMAEGARSPLVVAPAKPLAAAVAGALGARLLESHWDVEEWLVSGGPAVTWYDALLDAPEALAVADRVVTLLPERMVARHSAQRDPWALVEEAVSLAAQLGSHTVSRAARLVAGRGADGLLPVRPEEPAVGEAGLGVGDLLEESERVFRELWGRGRGLRGYQRAALKALYTEALSGGVVLVVYPTGSGKSAIFQVAARVLSDAGVGPGALVVSPLKALIHDQVRGAVGRGLKAYYIDSTVPPTERGPVLEAFKAGVADLLYITPERFHDPAFEEAVREGGSLIVLDEAHTLSRWGMSFRPSYLYMARVVREARASQDPPSPLAAFTATAPADVEADVLRALGYQPGEAVRVSVDLEDPNPDVDAPPGRAVVLRAPPVRRELHLDVRLAPPDPQERLRDLVGLVRELSSWASRISEPWVGIVFTGYVRSRRRRWANADEVAGLLARELGDGMVAVYHGQMSPSARRRVEEWITAASRGERPGPRVVVATKAFGMGVDIPNIRFVVHLTPPDSVEDYYQEVGRAGRDRLEAYAVAYYSPEDYRARLALKAREAPRPSDAILAYNLLASLAVKGEAVAPLEALSAAVGGEGRALRALEMLRMAGLLEYTLRRGQPSQARGEPCEARLQRGCLRITHAQPGSPGAAALEWRLCERSGWLEAALYSDGRRLAGGDCGSPAARIPGAVGEYVLAYLNPDYKHKPSQSLPPEPFALLLRAYSIELSKPEKLMRIMEEALAARLQGGQAAAEERLRRLVEEALENPQLKAPDDGFEALLQGRVECGSEAECIREAARMAARLEAVLGPHGYSLAAASEQVAQALRREAEALLGRRLQSPLATYKYILSAARRGGPLALANRGVVIIVARGASRSMEAIERNLSGYPYKWLYVTP